MKRSIDLHPLPIQPMKVCTMLRSMNGTGILAIPYLALNPFYQFKS
jgi:hypothetical protein